MLFSGKRPIASSSELYLFCRINILPDQHFVLYFR